MAAINKETQDAAKTFDIGAFMRNSVGGYSKPFKVHLRFDLYAQMDEIKEQIDALPAEDDEQSIAAAGERDKLVQQYNDLLDEFEAAALEMQFRPSTSADWDRARDKFSATLPKGDKLESHKVDELLPFVWAECLIKPEGMTGQDFQQIQEAVGDFAVAAEIGLEWERTNKMGNLDVDAPFSRSRLPSPNTETTSPS